MVVARIRNWLFLIALLALGVTFFTRERLQTVTEICPETLAEPVQTRLAKREVLKFARNNYNYEVTPLYEYHISGLVVRKLNYGWFVIDKSEKVFPCDVCLIWGDNLKNKLHQDATVRFSQDCRFCFAQWGAEVKFRMDQLSNNHLLVDNADIKAQLNRVRTSDQITIHGKLVNVKAKLTGPGGRYDSDNLTWNTSTTRTDTGPGACEVILVERVDVLQRGNPVVRLLFHVGLVALGALVLWFLVDLVRP